MKLNNGYFSFRTVTTNSRNKFQKSFKQCPTL